MRSLLARTVLALVFVAGCDGGGTVNDAGQDASPRIDAAHDAGLVHDDARTPDTGVDATIVMTVDAGSDAATLDDGGNDAGNDGGTDGGRDAGSDGGTDAGSDAGHDGGTDAVVLVDAGQDAGVLPAGTIVLAATGGTSVLVGELHGAAGTWTTSTLTGASMNAPSVALRDASTGLVVMRSNADAGALSASTWSPGAFTAFAGIATGVTTRDAPHATVNGAAIAVAFQGDDFKHYFAAHDVGWTPTAEPVGGAATQSFGPSPASITALGAAAIVAYAGNDGDLYDQARDAAPWSAAHAHGLTDHLALTPAIVTPASGFELAIVYVRSTDGAMALTTRSGGVWSARALIGSAFTNDPPALAALPGGDLLLAFRGTDMHAYVSRFHAGAWSTPSQPVSGATVLSTPAIAAGIGGAQAELAFVTSTGVQHTRLLASGWSTPTLVGGAGQTFVSIATAP